MRGTFERYRNLSGKNFIHKKIENLLYNINPGNHKKRIGLHDKNGIEFYNIDDIVYCKSENVYTTFYFENKKEVVTSKPIKDYERDLGNYSFYRIHNSFLINLNKVKKYIRGEGGQVKMMDDTVLDVARYRKEGFLKVMNEV